jgi:hypothetical protein
MDKVARAARKARIKKTVTAAKSKAQTKIAFWQDRYRPRAGLLKPGDAVTLSIKPSILGTERPVVISPRPGDIAITKVLPTEVEVKNMADRTVPFLLVIVPVNMVAVGMVPWREVVRRAPEIIKRVKAHDLIQVLMAAIMRGENQ